MIANKIYFFMRLFCEKNAFVSIRFVGWQGVDLILYYGIISGTGEIQFNNPTKEG